MILKKIFFYLHRLLFLFFIMSLFFLDIIGISFAGIPIFYSVLALYVYLFFYQRNYVGALLFAAFFMMLESFFYTHSILLMLPILIIATILLSLLRHLFYSQFIVPLAAFSILLITQIMIIEPLFNSFHHDFWYTIKIIFGNIIGATLFFLTLYSIGEQGNRR